MMSHSFDGIAQIIPPMPKQPPIQWDEATFLQTSDYKPRRFKENKYLTISGTFDIETNIRIFRLLSSVGPNKQVVCMFYPEKSWVDLYNKKNYDIRYQQTIFNLYEISARRMRKKLREISFWSILFGKDKKIISDEMNELRDVISTYGRETERGKIKIMQQKWERKVDLEMESLYNYCYDCSVQWEKEKAVRRIPAQMKIQMKEKQAENKVKKANRKVENEEKSAIKRSEKARKKAEKKAQKESQAEVENEDE